MVGLIAGAGLTDERAERQIRARDASTESGCRAAHDDEVTIFCAILR